eukprot:3952220-Pyramimonas_sp.AAC.1
MHVRSYTITVHKSEQKYGGPQPLVVARRIRSYAVDVTNLADNEEVDVEELLQAEHGQVVAKAAVRVLHPIVTVIQWRTHACKSLVIGIVIQGQGEDE